MNYFLAYGAFVLAALSAKESVFFVTVGGVKKRVSIVQTAYSGALGKLTLALLCKLVIRRSRAAIRCRPPLGQADHSRLHALSMGQQQGAAEAAAFVIRVRGNAHQPQGQRSSSMVLSPG